MPSIGDKATRQDRRASDKFAPIREFWEKFIGHCKQWYKPSSYLTIDEQLVGFRGRCPFRIYIPNKPNKYGIKIVMVADSNSKYVYNATPYLGKGTNCDNMPLATHLVKQLCEPVYGTNRNIAMDNWFTSVPLASELLQDPYKLTLVGTIRSNKREIPPEMKKKKQERLILRCLHLMTIPQNKAGANTKQKHSRRYSSGSKFRRAAEIFNTPLSISQRTSLSRSIDAETPAEIVTPGTSWDSPKMSQV
ncbi:unnamed protein product [Arctia plantaginis]|uniref:PiggyBac transposable element-derived protein domain-containing protein n=1 Tax=Arctia plantaginis TaxID=874455 RepID=A0A8S0Z140_ARCPL|nr:unnamed protein product [Arctia plantaginis]